MTRADATETALRRRVPQDTAPHAVSCLPVYKSLRDEGFVLTRRLDPIDAFRVCLASRLTPIVSQRWELSILTRIYPLDLKSARTHFPALV
jgi:hypothetical protein